MKNSSSIYPTIGLVLFTYDLFTTNLSSRYATHQSQIDIPKSEYEEIVSLIKFDDIRTLLNLILTHTMSSRSLFDRFSEKINADYRQQFYSLRRKVIFVISFHFSENYIHRHTVMLASLFMALAPG